MKRSFLFSFCFLLLAIGCEQQLGRTCPEQPQPDDTVQALLACLDRDVSTGEVGSLLHEWGRMNDEWGGVTAVDLLPTPGDELVLSYHKDLERVSWDPKGALVVLKRDKGRWRVAFDAATVEVRAPNGELWDNWAYRVLGASELTGDDHEELLVNLIYSNGRHSVFAYGVLMTAHGGEPLRVAFSELEPSYSNYRIGESASDSALQLIRYNTAGAEMITRTYTFQDDSFVVADEAINPALATASAQLPDGSAWYAFDEVSNAGDDETSHGIFRFQNGDLTYFPMQAAVRVLAPGPEGALYVGAGCGLLRTSTDGWETLAPVICSGEGPTGGPIMDIAFGESGEVWVASLFSVARYDGSWTPYEPNATRLLVASDGSVWTAGWDGRAGSNCCFSHLVPHLMTSDWVTYTYSATLPVSPELQESIQALRGD